MVTIVQSTAVVAASGIENAKAMVQAGGPTAANTVTQAGGFIESNNINQFGGFSQTNDLRQYDGALGSGDILNPDVVETTATAKFILFSPDFSRSKFFQAIVGTKETYEKDFDRSPFFFSPHETDPNTVRDISEAQQFLVFTSTTLRTFEALRANPHRAQVISVKGTEIEDETFAPVDVVINGSFETGTFAGWNNSAEGSGLTRSIVTDSTGIGGLPAGITPIDGTYWAYLQTPSPVPTNKNNIWQSIGLAQKYDSSILENFSFHFMPDNVSTQRGNQVSLVFLNDEVPVYHLAYRWSGMRTPNTPSDFPDITPVTVSLSATEDIINVYSRTLSQDTKKADFVFNEIQIWYLQDSTSGLTDAIVDAFQLTVSIPPDHLLPTSDLAHVLTGHPTASGFPFTISGTEDIDQIDQTGPFFDETIPVSGTTFNATTGFVSLHVKDGGSSLDQGNIDIWIDGDQVVNAGSLQASATWPTGLKSVISTRDILYEFNRVTDFPQQSTVTVSGELADLADPTSNQTITEYQFTVLGSGSLDATISGAPDGTPPVITLVDPVDLDTQISPNTNLQWNLTDDASGIDPSTVRLLVNGAVKLENDIATAGSFSRVANTGNGYDYDFDPLGAFTFGETVTGTIEAYDNAGNFSTTTYEFTITPDDTLNITNFFLAENESTLLVSGTEISVCVEDFTHGVNVSGTEFLVNGVVPSGLVVTTSGAGPDKVTYTVPAAGVVDFRSDVNVFVHAENNFPGNFPVIKEELFVLRPGYDVNWWNRTTDSGTAGAEEVFPYITNVQVLAEVLNFGKNSNEASLFYRFLTEGQHHADLGASIVSNIKTADLPASLTSLNTIFEYGKTIVIEVEVADLEGNLLSFTHEFTIEPKPTS